MSRIFVTHREEEELRILVVGYHGQYLPRLLEILIFTTVYYHVEKTLQELRMLSSVTINCRITKIVMNPGSQLSELKSVSQMSQNFPKIF